MIGCIILGGAVVVTFCPPQHVWPGHVCGFAARSLTVTILLTTTPNVIATSLYIRCLIILIIHVRYLYFDFHIKGTCSAGAKTQSHNFCFNCLNPAHAPVHCEMLKIWVKKCEDDSETSNWIAANTKECVSQYCYVCLSMCFYTFL